MTNIEKLYGLVGVEKELVCNCSLENLRICNATKKYCSYSEFEYTFTESKQLELIKWLVTNWGSFTLYRNEDGFLCNCHSFSSCFCETEKQALAGLVCELWEYLTEVQREEIKRILE